MRKKGRETSNNAPPARKMLKTLPTGVLLVLSAALAAVVINLTWPARGLIVCEQMPELGVLAVCSGILILFSFRALGVAQDRKQERFTPGGAIILSALALFLSAHFITQYRNPCKAVEQQLHPHHAAAPRR